MGVPVTIITEPQILTVSVAVDKELAIMAGSTLFGNLKVAVDPALLCEEDRNTLIDCGLDLTTGYDRRPMPKIGTVDENTLPMLLCAWRQGKAESDAKVEAAVEQFLTVPVESLLSVMWKQYGEDKSKEPKHIRLLETFDASSATVADVEGNSQKDTLGTAMGSVERMLREGYPRVTPSLMEQFKALSLRETGIAERDARVVERMKAVAAEAERLQRQMRDRVEAAVASHRDLVDRLRAERKAMIEAEAQAKADQEAREKAAAEKAKADQIAAFVQEHGTDSQKARFAENLLPEQEVVDAMRDHAFRRLAEQPRYKKLSKDDVVRAADEDDLDPCDDNPAVEYKAWTAEEASDAEFATFKVIRDAIRADHPDVAVELVEHAGGLEKSKDWAVFRKSVNVTLRVGTFTFSREYACP